MRAALVVLLLASTAHADDFETTKLGFRMGGARLPVASGPLGAVQLTLGVEHPVFQELRVFAEYEWLWVSEPQTDDTEDTFSGIGHRTNLGLRRTFAATSFKALRFYSDIEVGGGLGIVDTPLGTEVLPHGLIGVRLGYAISQRNNRASRVLETEINIRAIVLEHALGVGAGIGFYWGR